MRTERRQHATRRELLATGLGAAAALAFGRIGAASAGDYGPFKFGIQSYSLREFGLDEALKLTKELGLNYWESYSAHTPPDPARAAEYKKKAADQGVTILSFGVSRFSKDHDANRKLFEFGKAMGFTSLSADPDPDAFDSLDKLVEEYGIAIGIHNHGPGHRYGPIETITKAIQNHNPKIGCCLDCGHLLRSTEDPVQAVEALGSRIYGVHLKDVKDATKFTVLGEGDLKTAALMKALAGRKYDYIMALEYEENPKAPMGEIKECLATARKAAAGL
ncbi:MAG: sugar phosphate isomerase/epimerase [Isosphaeraceae bacterium]